MTKWDYRTVKFQAEGIWQGGQIDAESMEEVLVKLGGKGWELVTIVTATAGSGWTKDIVAVLKRPVEEK